MILSGADVRMALIDRRSELIRCASITKDTTFDKQIADLDVAIERLWDAKKVELMEVWLTLKVDGLRTVTQNEHSAQNALL